MGEAGEKVSRQRKERVLTFTTTREKRNNRQEGKGGKSLG